jgi:hypothetical protein
VDNYQNWSRENYNPNQRRSLENRKVDSYDKSNDDYIPSPKKSPQVKRIENDRKSTVSSLLQNIQDAKEGLSIVARTKSLVNIERMQMMEKRKSRIDEENPFTPNRRSIQAPALT